MGSGREVRARSTEDALLGEVARRLGIARSTAWARVLRGIIPAEWRGGRYLVRREDLDRLVQEAERSRAG
jgi:excisionase family DNA binding protein